MYLCFRDAQTGKIRALDIGDQTIDLDQQKGLKKTIAEQTNIIVKVNTPVLGLIIGGKS